MKWMLGLAVSSAAMSFSSGTWAQVEAGTAAQAIQNDEEIVVTAERREMRLQDVPASVSVIDPQALSSQGLNQLQDIASRTPGLEVSSLGGAGRQQITLRGITTGNDISPTVAIYLDDVPYGSSVPTGGSAQLALELGSFDLDRIEVLRGPQGTLYGAGAFGGLLKYVLEAPRLNEASGRLQAEGAQIDEGGTLFGVRAAANLPLVEDVFALRFTGAFNQSPGYVDNVVSGEEDVDSSDTSVARVSLLTQVSDRLTLRASVFGQDIDRDGSSLVDYNRVTGQPNSGDLTQARLLDEPFSQQYRLYSAGADLDLGFATASGTIGRQTIDTQFFTDASPLYVPFLGGLLASLGSPVDAIGVPGFYETEKTTAEFRLVSPEDQGIAWIAGLFFADEGNTNFQQLVGFNGGVQQAIDIGTFQLDADFQEVAVYGNATLRLSPSFDVTAGLRFSDYEQTYTQFGSGLLAASNPGSTASDNAATYLATARYRPSDDTMFYLRAASGFRPGGPNLIALDPITGDPVGDPTYDSDSLWNYEAGVKTQLSPEFDIEAAIFQVDWQDIQLLRSVSGVTQLTNGGGAQTKGVELTARYRPTEALTFSGVATYQDARLTDAVPELGAAEDERLPHVPRFSAVLSVDHASAIGNGIELRAGASVRYVGERFASFDGSATAPQYQLPSYTTVDLRIGLGFAEWDLSLYGRNVTDERAQLSADMTLAAAGGPARVAVAQPRTFGIVASRAF
ncbi:MAG: hypothetical protein A4S17_02680 [Proteobacteria bacterium HN_bin10]|nr:MAG: hypothetical protein A4S17_02680 [Proteobacteria bacterium HN_bin10]